MKILQLVLNDFTNDSRVLRAVQVGTDIGSFVLVFALKGAGLSKIEEHQHYVVRRFNLLSRHLPKAKILLIVKYFEAFVRMTWAGIREKPNLVHANDLNTLVIGFMIAKICRAKLVYDSHELWSGASSLSNIPRILCKMALALQKSIARRSDSVITVSQGIAEILQKEFAINKVEVVRNIPEFKDAQNCRLYHDFYGFSDDTIVILYQGAISQGRGIDVLIRAMHHVNKKAKLVLMGDGSFKEPYRQLADQLGLENRVFFHPAVKPSVLPRYTGSADIGVSPIEPVCKSYELCLPNKLFEYIHAGLATVVSDLPEMASLVTKYEVGLTFRYDDPDDLAVQLNRYLDNLEYLTETKKKSVKATKTLNWNNEAAVLKNIYSFLTRV